MVLHLVYLAPLPPLQSRLALTSTPSLLSILHVLPGVAINPLDVLRNTTHPATAALTTGYIFRTEHPLTARWLCERGRPGALDSYRVWEGDDDDGGVEDGSWGAGGEAEHHEVDLEMGHGRNGKTGAKNRAAWLSRGFWIQALGTLLGEWAPAAATLLVWQRVWSLCPQVLLPQGLLFAARALHVLALHRLTSSAGWHGAREPGVKGSLLVLLPGDAWARLDGPVDALKAVTSGSWPSRPASTLEAFALSSSSLLAYAAVGYAEFVSRYVPLVNPAAEVYAEAQAWVLGGAVASAGCMALGNWMVSRWGVLRVNGCTVRKVGEKRYGRRLEMAQELIQEFGRSDWAVGLGMVKPEKEEKGGEVVL